jgi:hypothetical protein
MAAKRMSERDRKYLAIQATNLRRLINTAAVNVMRNMITGCGLKEIDPAELVDMETGKLDLSGLDVEKQKYLARAGVAAMEGFIRQLIEQDLFDRDVVDAAKIQYKLPASENFETPEVADLSN